MRYRVMVAASLLALPPASPGAQETPRSAAIAAQAPADPGPGARSQGARDTLGRAAPELEPADLEAWLDGFFPHALRQADIAGAVVLVVKDGEVLLQKGYGYADVATRTPMDPERTVVGVGSVSKLLTWTAVMQQVERGRLELDRDVEEYLDFEIPAAFGRPVTLRHLMTHTAGFEDREFRQVPEGSTARGLREYLRGTPVPERIYPPGEVPAYSNYGSMLAGYLVERVSGERFVDYIERHILAPLDMESSTFRRPAPDRLRDRLATDYGVASDEPKPPNDEEPAGDPSGHLVTTAHDMSRFMRAHLQDGEFGGHRLLSPETTRLMHATSFVPMPGAQGVALGFFRADYNGRRVLWHGGDISGFHADLNLLPDEGVGFFTTVNSDGITRGLLGAASALRASLFHRFMERYFPAPPPPEEPTAPTAREHARAAAGEYRMSRRPSGDFMEAIQLIARYLVLDLELEANEDGTIRTPGWLSLEDERPRTWREVGPFEWREVGGSARLAMTVEDGRVEAFFPTNLPSAWIHERVPFLWSAGLHVPLFLAAAVVLSLAALAWPASALLRRRYRGHPPARGDRERRARRLRRLGTLVGVAYLLGWAALVSLGPVGLDPWIRLVQAVGVLCVTAAGVAAWSAWVAWSGRSGAWERIGSTLVALALVEVVWFSFAFHLISARLNY